MTTDPVILENVSTDRLRSHIEALEGIRHPVAAPEALERAADYIAYSLRTLGYEVSEQHFPHDGRTFRNIIGTRWGTPFPEERLLVIAHYDTVAATPGADDNASGVAVMLEVAAVLGQFPFERTIQFVGVSLEEVQREDDGECGLLGSRALAALARSEGWQVHGAVVMESVAYAGDDVVQTTPQGIPFPVPDTGNFIAVVGNEKSTELVRAFAQAVERQRLNLDYIPLVAPGNGEVLPDTRRSNHAPFWDEGYRAIMLTDTTNFRNPHYHRPTDTSDTLNLEFAAKVCAATAGLVMNMARRRTGRY